MTDERLLERLRSAAVPEQRAVVGRVTAVGGGRLSARIPAPRVGRCYEVEREGGALVTQLVGFDGDTSFLLPFGVMNGVEPGATVAPTSIGERAPRARDVLGDVIDPLGVSLVTGRAHACDGGALDSAPPSPLARRAITEQLVTGIRVIDGLLPLGVGQRVGLFAGSGVGKSTLLAQLATASEADYCVVGLIGERGREVSEFVQEVLDVRGRDRTTVVVATSDAPPMLRQRAAETATALAEQWRAEGAHCLLLVDSLTRYARALREAALLAGEIPARQGYPASVFAQLPRLLERAGSGEVGAITAIYTVLVAGGDMEEPVSDEVRGIVDGHWVLSRALAERQRFPAVDVPASVSRVESRIVDEYDLESARAVRRALALLAQHGDALDLGIYERGGNEELDAIVEAQPAIDAFLRQGSREVTPIAATRQSLSDLAFEVSG